MDTHATGRLARLAAPLAAALMLGLAGPTATAGPATAAAVSVPTGFVGLSPTRLLDTRVGLGAPRRAVPGGAALTLQVSGRGGVPTDATAVALNVTAVGATRATFIAVRPTGSPASATSSLNVQDGAAVANAVVVGVGTLGRVDLANAVGDVHLVADVVGYWTTGADFSPVAPRRILDTRAGAGPVPAGGSVDVPVTGVAGVPVTGVSAVAVNITATGAACSAFVTAYATGTTRPATSVLNVAAGDTTPSLAVVPVGDGGRIALGVGGCPVHLLADVSGWWSMGGLYTPVTPTRLADSRHGLGVPLRRVGPGGMIDVTVTGRAGIPDRGVGAVVLSVTDVSPSQASYVVVHPASTQRPAASSLNVRAGRTRANLVLARVGAGGAVRLANAAGSADLLVDVVGWFAGTPAPMAAGQSTLVSRVADGAPSPDDVGTGLVSGDGSTVVWTADRWSQNRWWRDVTRTVPASGATMRQDTFLPSFWSEETVAVSETAATSLILTPVGRTPQDTNGRFDAYVRDETTGTYVLVTAGTDGSARGPVSSWAMTPDARYVAFASSASGLVAPSPPIAGVYLRDVQAGTTVGLSCGLCEVGAASADGRTVAVTTGIGLDGAPEDGHTHVFTWDTQTGTVTRVDRSTAGAVGNADALDADLSGDGRLVTFSSAATDLLPGAPPGVQQVYVRDTVAGTTRLVSSSSAGTPGSSPSGHGRISGDGRVVVFDSAATNLAVGVPAGVHEVFVRTLSSGVTRVASLTPAGLPADGTSPGRFGLILGSAFPEIDRTGSQVTYLTTSKDAIPGLDGTGQVLLARLP